MTSVPTHQRLTKSELSHLEFALAQVRRSGSYYGPRAQFIRRQARLERWAGARSPKKGPGLTECDMHEDESL